jgi:hypothetical protein
MFHPINHTIFWKFNVITSCVPNASIYIFLHFSIPLFSHNTAILFLYFFPFLCFAILCSKQALEILESSYIPLENKIRNTLDIQPSPLEKFLYCILLESLYLSCYFSKVKKIKKGYVRIPSLLEAEPRRT